MRDRETIEALKKALFDAGPEAFDRFLSGYMLEEETTDWYKKSFTGELFEYAVQQMPDDILEGYIKKYCN